MVFTDAKNTTYNNTSVISWWSVLLMEKTEVPGENYRYPTCHCKPLSHKGPSSTSRCVRISTWDASGSMYVKDTLQCEIF